MAGQLFKSDNLATLIFNKNEYLLLEINVVKVKISPIFLSNHS